MQPHQEILKWPYNISLQLRELQQTLRRWKLSQEYLDHLLSVSWCKSLPQRTHTLPQCTQQKFASRQRLTRRLMQQEKILDCYQWTPLSTGKPKCSFFPFFLFYKACWRFVNAWERLVTVWDTECHSWTKLPPQNAEYCWGKLGWANNSSGQSRSQPDFFLNNTINNYSIHNF